MSHMSVIFSQHSLAQLWFVSLLSSALGRMAQSGKGRMEAMRCAQLAGTKTSIAACDRPSPVQGLGVGGATPIPSPWNLFRGRLPVHADQVRSDRSPWRSQELIS